MELDSTANEKGLTTDNGTNKSASCTEKGSLTENVKGMNVQETVAADVDEHPSVGRRTAIVVGVALALFLVRRCRPSEQKKNAHIEYIGRIGHGKRLMTSLGVASACARRRATFLLLICIIINLRGCK